MRFAVCDDEKEIRNYIEGNIRLLYSGADIIQFENGNALLSYPEQIDILFLDIQMSGLDGIETARKLRESNNNVILIFVTAIEEYVFKAFDVHAFHYLVKPIEQKKFFDVLKEAVGARKQMLAKESVPEKASITVKKGTVTHRIFLQDIYYMEVLNRTVIIYMADKSIEFYGSFKEIEKSLPDDFMRCHRAFIVNHRYVAKYNAGSITLDNGAEVPIAKNKYSEFVEKYMKWVKESTVRNGNK